MASMIDGLVGKSGTERSPTALTGTQTKLLSEAGLKPGTQEYKDAALKFQVQNLANAVSMANELLQALSEMRKKSTDNIGR
ncbi:hypothetical protein P2318_23575 [Myxococcaceae bacterium GXIMD 01537]